MEQKTADFLGQIEQALTAIAPFTAPSNDASSCISAEFISVCLETRASPRSDVIAVLQQMQALIQSLPLPVLVQNRDTLTVRTLLQIALERHQDKPLLRCKALGFLQLQRQGENDDDKERTSEVQGELLTFFLLQPRRPRTDEQIFEAIWPGKELQRAQWAFHTARKRLHTFVGDEVIAKLKAGQYSLNPHLSIGFDVAEFESLLTRAQTIPCAGRKVYPREFRLEEGAA